MLIYKERYIHIQSKQPHWNVGEEIEVGNDYSPYYKYFLIPTLRHHILNFDKKITRERVLEEVRQNQFPERPSRQKCLFVTTPEKVKDWLGALFQDTSLLKILKVELTGSIHFTKEEYMRISAFDLNNLDPLYENAIKYWEGVSRQESDECLFVGKVKILEDITNLY